MLFNLRSFRRGDLVTVRNWEEIQGTLDAAGTVDGLPFLAEMAAFCGRTFRVRRRADKVYLDRAQIVVRVPETVLLEDVRCAGRCRNGCDLHCILLWKTCWLAPAYSNGGGSDTEAVGQGRLVQLGLGAGDHDGAFPCQAEGLKKIGIPIPWWDVRQYVRELVSGDSTVGQVFAEVALLTYNKAARFVGRGVYGATFGTQTKAPTCQLHLQPGEIVEVKSRAEIEATLDREGRHRGLLFNSEMAKFCGTRQRVERRAEQIVLEWSGETRSLKDTVTLTGVTCQGLAFRRCPRNCYHLWREIWLRRVPGERG
jgi:hypothetical protein